jgi:hypothetical protein
LGWFPNHPTPPQKNLGWFQNHPTPPHLTTPQKSLGSFEEWSLFSRIFNSKGLDRSRTNLMRKFWNKILEPFFNTQ